MESHEPSIVENKEESNQNNQKVPQQNYSNIPPLQLNPPMQQQQQIYNPNFQQYQYGQNNGQNPSFVGYTQNQIPQYGYPVYVQYPNQPHGMYYQPSPQQFMMQQPPVQQQNNFYPNNNQIQPQQGHQLPYQQPMNILPVNGQIPQNYCKIIPPQGESQQQDNNSTESTCSTYNNYNNKNNYFLINKNNQSEQINNQLNNNNINNNNIQYQQEELQIQDNLLSSKNNNDDIDLLQIMAPDKKNKWIIPFLKYKKIRDLFPIELQSGEHEEYYQEIFQLKDKKNPLSIKINFQSKDEYNLKAIVLKEKKRSKFHNKNKLFFNSIIKIFKKKLLQRLNIPDKLFEAFYNFVEACRNTGRRFKDNKVSKTDLFNHSHYVLLFLTLNKQTIQQISEDKQYLKIHQDVTKIDLSQPVQEEDIQYINFMKICTYQVLALHMRELMIGTREQQCEEREYDFRAFQGILEMIKGRHRDRF